MPFERVDEQPQHGINERQRLAHEQNEYEREQYPFRARAFNQNTAILDMLTEHGLAVCVDAFEVDVFGRFRIDCRFLHTHRLLILDRRHASDEELRQQQQRYAERGEYHARRRHGVIRRDAHVFQLRIYVIVDVPGVVHAAREQHDGSARIEQPRHAEDERRADRRPYQRYNHRNELAQGRYAVETRRFEHFGRNAGERPHEQQQVCREPRPQRVNHDGAVGIFTRTQKPRHVALGYVEQFLINDPDRPFGREQFFVHRRHDDAADESGQIKRDTEKRIASDFLIEKICNQHLERYDEHVFGKEQHRIANGDV